MVEQILEFQKALNLHSLVGRDFNEEEIWEIKMSKHHTKAILYMWGLPHPSVSCSCLVIWYVKVNVFFQTKINQTW